MRCPPRGYAVEQKHPVGASLESVGAAFAKRLAKRFRIDERVLVGFGDYDVTLIGGGIEAHRLVAFTVGGAGRTPTDETTLGLILNPEYLRSKVYRMRRA